MDGPAPLSERDSLQQVKDLARLCGWRVYHTLNSRGSDPGFPDLVLPRGSSLVFAELKAEGCNRRQRRPNGWRTWSGAGGPPSICGGRPTDRG